MVAPENSGAIRQRESSPVARVSIALAMVTAAAFLLFARLGHHALWDDEATTALAAVAVWRTGDTTAVIDHNIVAYEGGVELRNLRFRYLPPLPAYLAAPFVGLMGNHSFPARLPFAICGMACVLLIIWWMWRDRADLLTSVILSTALLANVSLFLYFRQARYYSVVILGSVAAAYLYLRWNGRRRPLFLLAAVSVCLLLSNYLIFAACYCCLAADYLLWGRKRKPLHGRDWLALWLPQIAVGVPLALIWNPLGQTAGQYLDAKMLADRATLFWWNLRDLDRCEFGVTLLLLSAPLLYLVLREIWLLRGFVAFFVYLVAIMILSPQPLAGLTPTGNAEVRYLIPLIPLAIFVGAATVRALCRQKWWLAVPLALFAFGTNALQIYPLFTGRYRSTVALYIGELRHPPNDPYKETAKWINAHMKELQSAWVVPYYMTYSLMYHASKAVYAWQLRYPPEPQFTGLDPIHFYGVVPPDYVIAFGPVIRDVTEFLRARGMNYRQIETLDVYWKDLYRPELIWRNFKPVSDFDRDLQAVYILQRAPS
jgi:4-amino-4-deoxy-L-arabinose transferase-like glycosyltransferase